MAKSNGRSETQGQADAAAQQFKSAFIEQFNRYFRAEIPLRDVGAFSPDAEGAASNSTEFMNALKAHNELLPEEKRLLLKQVEIPATTVKGIKRQNPALTLYQELPEADKAALVEHYVKQPLPKGSPRRFFDDLPKAIHAFVVHDIRKAGMTERLIKAATQQLAGDIDNETYENLVRLHTEQLLKCERIKMDMFSPKFKYELISQALLQLPDMLAAHDPLLYAKPVRVSESGALHR